MASGGYGWTDDMVLKLN